MKVIKTQAESGKNLGRTIHCHESRKNKFAFKMGGTTKTEVIETSFKISCCPHNKSFKWMFLYCPSIFVSNPWSCLRNLSLLNSPKHA